MGNKDIHRIKSLGPELYLVSFTQRFNLQFKSGCGIKNAEKIKKNIFLLFKLQSEM